MLTSTEKPVDVTCALQKVVMLLGHDGPDLRKYQCQLFCSTGGQSFCKSADRRGSLHVQESGTTNTLEMQQELTMIYNEKIEKSVG